MNFSDILLKAKTGDEDAILLLLEMYKPLLLKNSVLNGHLDEDLYQEQCITFLRCIELFGKERPGFE